MVVVVRRRVRSSWTRVYLLQSRTRAVREDPGGEDWRDCSRVGSRDSRRRTGDCSFSITVFGQPFFLSGLHDRITERGGGERIAKKVAAISYMNAFTTNHPRATGQPLVLGRRELLLVLGLEASRGIADDGGAGAARLGRHGCCIV